MKRTLKTPARLGLLGPARFGLLGKAIFLGVVLGFWPPALADETRLQGVVELFTSQGCNSCPPADALLGELAQSGDVVALAYHVDYWDYLGWKDELGSADNTARQRAYARSLERSTVYTPQAIINGRRDVNGAQRDKVLGTLDEMAQGAKGLAVDLSIKDAGDSLLINLGELPIDARSMTSGAHVVLVDFTPMRSVAIRAGENRGRTLEYWNAVSSIQTIGMWHGAAKNLELPKSEIIKNGGGCAVLLQLVDQDGSPGAILGAAALPAARP